MSFFNSISGWLSGLFSGSGAPSSGIGAPRIVGEDWPPPPEKEPSELGRESQLTKNFHINEFACNDGSPVPDELYSNVLKLAQNLQVLREHLGGPVVIVDGYRTREYNRKIGGARKSQHLLALGADIRIPKFSASHLALPGVIRTLIGQHDMENGGVGTYPSFIHYDARGKNFSWKGVRESS